MAFPSPSTATHSCGEAHETAVTLVGPMGVRIQPPPPGVVEVNARPAVSTVAQNCVEAHVIALRPTFEGPPFPPVGPVEGPAGSSVVSDQPAVVGDVDE